MKYTIDIGAIKGKQGQLGISNTKLALEVGVSRNTLATYYKNPEKMPFEIMVNISEKLNIGTEEARRIFFNEKLTQNASFVDEGNSSKKAS